MPTALRHLTVDMAGAVVAAHLPDYVQDALRLERHPQQRTLAFHRFYEAPIFEGARPDMQFRHMDAQRVAFRASFILSEAIELLEKGLGLRVKVGISGEVGRWHSAEGSRNNGLTDALLGAMRDGGRRNLVEVVDALGDLNVVVNGFAIELGVDMRVVDQEVCASNFTKMGEDGRPIVADGSDPRYPKGKVLKGPNFMEPQIAESLGLEG